MTGTVLSRVVFPGKEEPDTMPLYLDADEWTELQTERIPTDFLIGRAKSGRVSRESTTVPLRVSHVNAANMVTGRRSLSIPSGARVSLGTYFNAFPASYWRRWTALSGVQLSVSTVGFGDIIVYRSNARGVIQTVDTAHVDGTSTIAIDLPLDNFLDGGWYWFDLVSRSGEFSLVEANWLAREGDEPVNPGALSISITTLNRTSYCLGLLESLAASTELRKSLTEITVIDQGTDLIRLHAQYPAVAESLGSQLRVIEQGNVGGSGGFSRGMIEAVRGGRSAFLLLLDDDVAIDPEGVLRAHTFSQFCLEPTIVGGHMFDMYDKTKLHAFAEGVEMGSFMWGPLTPLRHDFESMNLRQTDWVHRRFDVDYNGWWMSMIPVSVIREIGASLPVFIKWDDAEYSLRARGAGVSTVTLPGSAVWHVSWVDKDDSRDWQAFYHARNRLVAALLHSPMRRGGRLTIANLASDLRHLLTLDYFTVSLRQQAYRSVLAGPGTLHAEISTRLPAIRAEAQSFPETTLHRDLSSFEGFPPTSYFGDEQVSDLDRPRGKTAWVRFLLPRVWHHWWRRAHPHAGERPFVHIAHGTPWWRYATEDSVAVSNAEGSGVTWHRRDRAKFRSLWLSSLRHFFILRRRWATLSDSYRRALPDITGQSQWESALGLEGHSTEPPAR